MIGVALRLESEPSDVREQITDSTGKQPENEGAYRLVGHQMEIRAIAEKAQSEFAGDLRERSSLEERYVLTRFEGIIPPRFGIGRRPVKQQRGEKN